MKRKTLQIVRHAKSSWDYENIDDIDRPLKSKGILRAYQASQNLRQKKLMPQMMISSPANRALHTAIIFSRVLDFPLNQLFISQLLYDSGMQQILELIRYTHDEISSLMIFGHNPGFTGIVNHFTSNRIDNLPTAGVVTFTFETDQWKNISVNVVENQINHFENIRNSYKNADESL